MEGPTLSAVEWVDDIISYHDVVTAEKATLQKGMNYAVGKKYSVFLMSNSSNKRDVLRC